MLKKAAKKILSRIPLLIGITLISFLVIHLAPGSPVTAGQGLDPRINMAARQKLEKLYGLDRPILTQYAEWSGRLARFDFGESLTDGDKVTQKIAKAIPVTLAVSTLSLVLIFLFGIPLGVWTALHKDKPIDRALSFLTSAGISIPVFWLSLILLAFLGVSWRWIPVSGLHSLFYEERGADRQFWDTARHLILPVTVNSLGGLAALSRYMRAGYLHVLKENYIRTARAKGLSESAVLYRHALRNALLPVITILGLSVPSLLGGSVLVETIFSLPGMGRLFFSSVFARDYPVIMGILVLGAVLTLVGNSLADLAYAAADPRIRAGQDG